MARWLVTVEQRYSHKKTNMIIITLEDLPSIEEVQKIMIDKTERHFDVSLQDLKAKDEE